MMDKTLFSVRIRTARELYGYSMDKLASLVKVHVTKQSLSRYEAGIMKPKKPLLDSIAEALDISPEYFDGTNVTLDNDMLRESGNLDDELKHIEAIISFRVERFIKKSAILNKRLSFNKPLKERVVSVPNDAYDAAEQLRIAWCCGDGAISSVIRLLERKQILIFEAELPGNVISTSTWVDDKYPVILIDKTIDKTNLENLRFRLCHELARLLLTFGGNADIETICDNFARHFLIPENTLKEEIGRRRHELYLEELLDLHRAYGVSVPTILRQAYELGIISRLHYNWWCEEISNNSNVNETESDSFIFPETLSREKIMDIMVDELNSQSQK